MSTSTIKRISPYPIEAFTRDDATDTNQSALQSFIENYSHGDTTYDIDGSGNTTVLVGEGQSAPINDGDTIFKDPWADYWNIRDAEGMTSGDYYNV